MQLIYNLSIIIAEIFETINLYIQILFVYNRKDNLEKSNSKITDKNESL